MVITVKRYQTIKLALDSKSLNKAIHLDSISQILTNYKTEPADKIFFSTID